MIGNLHFTENNPALDEKIRQTVAGMAHFAESTTQTGGDCRFWLDEKKKKNERRCEKYSALMNGVLGPRIPRGARACKYFAADGS